MVCYLFNGVSFHFNLCGTGIPADVALSVTPLLIGLVTLTFDLLTSNNNMFTNVFSSSKFDIP